MTTTEAISYIREFNDTYEDYYKSLSDVEKLVEAALHMIEEYEYEQHLRIRRENYYEDE